MVQLNLLAQKADQDAAARYRQAFLDQLADGNWHLRRDLCKVIPQLTERGCRAIAEASRGAVIGSAKGYRLLRHATNEEIDHAERQLLSQARKMTDRAREIRIARNAGTRAA